MQEYVIEYECGCGAEGEVRGRNRDEAWQKLEKIQKEHYDKGHRVFSWVEPGA